MNTPTLAQVTDACLEAGRYLVEMAETNQVELKGESDLVGEADHGSEKLLAEALGKICPEASFLGEEGGIRGKKGNGGLYWVVDPLDGTVNYSFQIPFFSVSVALLRDGEPILGVVHAPMLNETYAAQKGVGASINGKNLDLKNGTACLEMIATSAGMIQSDFREKKTDYHSRLLAHYHRLRLMGSQALHLCFVAAGRLDAALSNEAKLWDDAAGSLILKEANGFYTDFSGRFRYPLADDSPDYEGKSFCSVGARSQESLQKVLRLLKTS